MNNRWKNFQNETADPPQNKFWKKITNLINDRSQQAVQPIYAKNDILLWDDKEILNSLKQCSHKKKPCNR